VKYNENVDILIVLMYVDDLVIVGRFYNPICELNEKLHSALGMTNLGILHCCLIKEVFHQEDIALMS
jgi:hypothetical protein